MISKVRPTAAIVLGLAICAQGCSGDAPGGLPAAVGGNSQAISASGGQAALQTGGLSAVLSSGGSGTTAGGTSSAASSATSAGEQTGGATGSGGAANGGAATGGKSAVLGSATGGATGGSAASGGARSGGTSATGGASATGGVIKTGGTKSTGGTSTGGTPATGGVKSTGGAATGGTKATGGVAATGGSSAFSICTGAPASGKAVSIYVIGDSTASIYTSDLYPRTGWAQVLGDYFSTTCAVVKDKALSGRSSKSFYDEGNWTPIRDGLVAGDFVIIQFGHNDEKSDDLTRYTDPQTTFKQYLTTYINDTKGKKAFPILATPINRNNWSGTTLSDTHGAYPPAMRELAAALSVPLVDHTALTKAYFERIGQAATTKLFMVLAAGQFPNYPSGNTDNTHLQETGARIIARLFTSNAYQQKLPVAASLNAVPVAP